MRRISLATAVFTACCAAQLLASPAQSAEGCLGAKVTACLDAIKPYLMSIEYQLALKGIDQYLAGDITGHRKAKSSVTVAYHSKFSDQFEPAQMVTMDYSASLEITEIQTLLRNSVVYAESDAAYNATHMYETVLFALGTHENCRELATAHDFYLFFHTKIKTSVKSKKIEHAKGDVKPPREFYHETGWIGICGKKLNYSVSGAQWGAVQADMERKYNNASASLAFR
jgi:hypothetical protein